MTAGISTPALAQSTQTTSPMAYVRPVHDVPVVNGRAAYLLDTSTDEVRLSHRAQERMPIASLVKVMTAYVVLNEANLDDRVEILASDVGYANAGGAATAGLRVGDSLTVKDLLYATLLPSGADATQALARTYGPGVDEFVAKMNETARDLGLDNTLYVNADGLSGPSGPGYSTAEDQARLAQVAVEDPVFKAITSTIGHTVPTTAENRYYAWRNTNRLLGAPGAVGVKTGYTRAAGYTLTFAAERGDRLLVGVILGESLSSRRFQTAGSLIDWAAAHPAVDARAR
ncbi:D-alanyl-D-alanine carboxypeptidase family protein [Sinosporangium siamense]